MTQPVAVSTDTARWRAHARVDRWTPAQVAEVIAATGVEAPSGDLMAAYFQPDSQEEPGNLLVTSGLTRLMSLLTGGGGQAVTNTAARIGVGDSTTAAAIGDTDLGAAAGASHRFFQPMDATYPTVSAGTLTAKATFGTGDGNFHWQEWCLDIGAPTVTGGTTVNACLLNHKVVDWGTKVSGALWAFTAQITVS